MSSLRPASKDKRVLVRLTLTYLDKRGDYRRYPDKAAPAYYPVPAERGARVILMSHLATRR